MNILIINSGSSSIKYQLISMPSERVVCEGLIERIGSENAILKYSTDTSKLEETQAILSHKIGLLKIADLLLDPSLGVITNAAEIAIVGHRVVHGGKAFSDTSLIDASVKEKIKNLFSLAPLHNPHNLEGIELAEEIFPNAKQVAVFDTAFHHSIPEVAKRYALPKKFYENKVQVYGFHGTSHKYVSEKAIEYLQLKSSKIISIHLGNGCSMTAIKDGKSIDHSMGFAPSNGLIMGSRSGDIDHAVIFYLVETLGYTLEQVNELLIKKSGMLGLTGFSDLRDIQTEAANGNQDCILALQMNTYRIKKYIGAYAAILNGIDAIIFTAGIGENSALIREMVCTDLEFMGITLDTDKNNTRSKTLLEINKKGAYVKVLMIPTNEELEIAKQAYRLINV
ncbi:acetate kinase [Cellulophaga sp. E16_2]|uniref:Acetate kinase n=1 Tax=Cellulophaga algicola (strain DSM 14237 / IC166 / ACAM 630) TaxID=688270 RepID=E6XF81_CELAD|nr:MULTISPECIES: acetate kinase [Cellulophaga]ADV50317.1 Acetate kinase [Cellulophaga algicola DSM 14237]MBO0592719.1 acetate kinase [Cellulophaga sp. E16_2]